MRRIMIVAAGSEDGSLDFHIASSGTQHIGDHAAVVPAAAIRRPYRSRQSCTKTDGWNEYFLSINNPILTIPSCRRLQPLPTFSNQFVVHVGSEYIKLAIGSPSPLRKAPKTPDAARASPQSAEVSTPNPSPKSWARDCDQLCKSSGHLLECPGFSPWMDHVSVYIRP